MTLLHKLVAGLGLCLATVTAIPGPHNPGAGQIAAVPGMTLARASSTLAERQDPTCPRKAPADDQHKLYSVIWSGGQLVGPRYASVSAEMTIPNISFPYPGGRNKSLTYGAIAWVGIGGDVNVCDFDAPFGNLKVGFYWQWDALPNNYEGVFAFWNWAPGNGKLLDDLPDASQRVFTNVGDRVRMTVTQKDNVTGTVFWENFSTGETYPKDGKPLEVAAEKDGGVAPSDGSVLCTNHAEFIVESFMSKDSPEDDYRFPDFGCAVFDKIEVLTEDGTKADLNDAYYINAQPFLTNMNYKDPALGSLTDCNIVPPEQVSCKWLGYKDIFGLEG